MSATEQVSDVEIIRRTSNGLSGKKVETKDNKRNTGEDRSCEAARW